MGRPKKEQPMNEDLSFDVDPSYYDLDETKMDLEEDLFDDEEDDIYVEPFGWES